MSMASSTMEKRDGDSGAALTTTFVPPPACTQGHLTMLGRQEFFVWLNEPIPIAGSTNGACYPQEFMTSYIQSFNGNGQPAFSSLVCPQNYQTISRQDLGRDAPYIVCCPNNYGFAPPAAPNSNRPGYGGTCYSNIIGTTVTKYNDDSYSGLILFSTSGQAYAHPFDGFAYQGQHVATTPVGVPALSPGTKTTSLQAPAATQQSQAQSSDDLDEQPASRSETQADNQSDTTAATAVSPVTQKTRVQTPTPIAVTTRSSSVVALYTISSSVVVFSTIQPSVITLYASPSNSATTSGSTAVVNTSGSTTGLSPGAIAGVVVGTIALLGLFALAALFLIRRRKNNSGPIQFDHEDPILVEKSDASAKPYIGDHPSSRSWESDQKHFYVATTPTNPSTPRPYHELSSRNNEREEWHELGSGGRSSLTTVTPKQSKPAAMLDWSTTTPVSTFSPLKP